MLEPKNAKKRRLGRGVSPGKKKRGETSAQRRGRHEAFQLILKEEKRRGSILKGSDQSAGATPHPPLWEKKKTTTREGGKGENDVNIGTKGKKNKNGASSPISTGDSQGNTPRMFVRPPVWWWPIEKGQERRDAPIAREKKKRER